MYKDINRLIMLGSHNCCGCFINIITLRAFYQKWLWKNKVGPYKGQIVNLAIFSITVTMLDCNGVCFLIGCNGFGVWKSNTCVVAPKEMAQTKTLLP